MKKVFLFAAMAAMVLVSCSKNDTKDSDKGKEKEKEEQTSNEITIDGDFSDWKSLDKSLYEKAENDVDSPWAGVEEIRVYAHEDYVYYYVKYNEETLEELEPADEKLPVRLNINTDGEFTSGYSSYSLQSYDFIVEAEKITDGQGGWASLTAAIMYQRVNGKWEELHNGGNLLVGAGSGCEYEFSLSREVFNAAVAKSSAPNTRMGDNFQTGMRFYETTSNPNWAELSNMPNSGEGNGYADLLNIYFK